MSELPFLLLVELFKISLDGDTAADEANDWRGGALDEIRTRGNGTDVDILGAFRGAVLLLSAAEERSSDSWLSRAFVDLTFKARMIPVGIAAAPIIRLAKVPRRAEAPPEIGSHGPSSRSYSFGRYLRNFSIRV